MQIPRIRPAVTTHPARFAGRPPTAAQKPGLKKPLSADQVHFSSRQCRPVGYSSVRSEPLHLGRNKVRGTRIEWGHWAVAPLTKTLATDGLEMCRALMIVDRSQQFMAHLTPETSAEDIEAMLETAQDQFDLDLEDADFFVMQGSQINPDLDEAIIEAVDAVTDGQGEEIQFYDSGNGAGHPVAVALINGQVIRCRTLLPTDHPVDQFSVENA